MKKDRIIELLEIENACMTRNANYDCDRNCAECDLVQKDYELHEMYLSAIDIIQNYLEPVGPIERYLNDWRCGNCKREVRRMDSYCSYCGAKIDWTNAKKHS